MRRQMPGGDVRSESASAGRRLSRHLPARRPARAIRRVTVSDKGRGATIPYPTRSWPSPVSRPPGSAGTGRAGRIWCEAIDPPGKAAHPSESPSAGTARRHAEGGGDAGAGHGDAPIRARTPADGPGSRPTRCSPDRFQPRGRGPAPSGGRRGGRRVRAWCHHRRRSVPRSAPPGARRRRRMGPGPRA